MLIGCFELIVICDNCSEVTQNRARQTYAEAQQAIFDAGWTAKFGKDFCPPCKTATRGMPEAEIEQLIAATKEIEN